MTSIFTGSELKLSVDPRRMLALMLVCVAISIGFFLVLFRKLSQLSFSLTSILGITLLLILTSVALLFIYYFWTLFSDRKAGIKFSASSWEDSASLLQLGKRPFSSLRQVGVFKFFDVEFLILDFGRELLISSDPLTVLYRLCVGPTLIIPMWFFEQSASEVQSITSQIQTSIKLRGQSPSTRVEIVENPEKNVLAFAVAARQSAKPAGPPKGAFASETAQQGEKMARLLCELYSEELIFLTATHNAEGFRGAPQLQALSFEKGENGAERFQFSLQGTPFILELCRIQEGLDHGRLFFFSRSELLLQLAVSVEIGSVDLISVETYTPGTWEAAFSSSAAYK